MNNESDADLAQRFLRGDAEASILVDSWIAGAAWPFRRRLQGTWEDLQQEIRLEVVRLLHEGRFRGESRLKTYLWQVACHTCLDAVRRLRRQSFVGLEAVATACTTDASPFELLAEHEGNEAALRALATLPRECRELWRKLLRGLSYRTIGEESGVSEGALRVRAHRCRKGAVDAYRATTAAASRSAEDKRAVR